MRTVRIEVTAADIDQGLQDDCTACPIALAAKRAGLDGARVFSHFVFFGPDHDVGKAVALPEDARRFVREFDDGEPVSPMSFDLEFAP